MRDKKEFVKVVLVACIFGILVSYIRDAKLESSKKSMTREKTTERSLKEEEPIRYESDTLKTECKLCNGGKDTLLEIYFGQENIGIISLNSFEVNYMEMNPYDDDGNLLTKTDSYGSTQRCSHGKNEFSTYISENIDRGFASGSITLRGDENMDLKKAASFLCEDCLNEIMKSCWKEENTYGVGVINFKTKEIRLLEPQVRAFTIGDFYFTYGTEKQESQDEEESKKIEFLTFYCPGRYSND